MKYTELITVTDTEFYTLEMQVTIDVTFGDGYFTWEFDEINEIYENGEQLSQDDLKKKMKSEKMSLFNVFVDHYDFKGSAIWAQGAREEV